MIESKLPHWLFWIGVALTAALGIALHGAAEQAVEYTSWVAESNDTRLTLVSLLEHVRHAESAQRGFLLTGDPSFIDDRDRSLQGVASTLAALKKTTADTPAQAPRVSMLERLLAQRQAMLDEQIEKIKAGAAQIEPAVILAAHELSAALSALTDEIQAEEVQLLKVRESLVRSYYDRAITLLALAAALGLLVLTPGYIGFIVQARARRRAEHRMVDMAESMPGAAYRLCVRDEGSWFFEFVSRTVGELHAVDRETLLRDPDALIATIHPDDRERTLAEGRAAMQALTQIDTEYRVVQADGTVKWIRSSAA